MPSHSTSQIGPDSTGIAVAFRLADLALGTFGSIQSTDQDRVDLADHLTGEAVRWINERFRIGLPDPACPKCGDPGFVNTVDAGRCEHEFGRSSICIHCGTESGDRRRRAPSELECRRGAFLAGDDTLTWRAVVAWSRELGYPCRKGVLVEMMPQDPMAVLVAATGGVRRVCDG